MNLIVDQGIEPGGTSFSKSSRGLSQVVPIWQGAHISMMHAGSHRLLGGTGSSYSSGVGPYQPDVQYLCAGME